MFVKVILIACFLKLDFFLLKTGLRTTVVHGIRLCILGSIVTTVLQH